MPLNSIASQLDTVSVVTPQAPAKTRNKRRVLLAMLIGLGIGAAAQPAQAADKYWNPATATGTWTGANWGAIPAGPYTDTWAAGDNAFFSADATINFVPGTQIGNIKVDSNAKIALVPDPLNTNGLLSTGGTVSNIDVAAGSYIDFGTVFISPSAGTGFTKTGPGILAGMSSNGYPGSFTLNEGMVIVKTENSLGAGGALNINGGTLAVSIGTTFPAGKFTAINIGGDFTLGAVTSNLTNTANNAISGGSINFSTNPISLGTATRTITLGGTGAVTLGGVISGAPGTGLTIATNPSLTGTPPVSGINISGTNTYTGITTVLGGGTVNTPVNVSGNQSAANGGWSIGNSNGTSLQTVNFLAGSTIAIASDKTFQVGVTGSTGAAAIVNFRTTMTNPGTLNVQQAGSLNVVSGGSWTQTGPMQLTAPAGSIATSTLNIGAIDSAGTFTYNGSSPIALNPAEGGSGIATIVVTTASTGGGVGTFITNQGFVNNTTSSTGFARIDLIRGATLRLSADIPQLLTGAVDLRLGSGTNGTIDTNGFNTTISRPILSTSGATSLIKNGAGTLTLTTSNPYSGGAVINGGTIKIGAASNPIGNGATTIAVGGTLDLNGFTPTTGIIGNVLRGTITNSSNTAAGISSFTSSSNNLNGSFTVSGDNGAITFPNLNSVAGAAIVKTGTNTLTLGGSGDNVGLALTVNGGTVVLGKNSSATSHAVNAPIIINATTSNPARLELGGSGSDQIFNDSLVTVSVLNGTFDINTRNETLGGALRIGNGTTNGSITGSATAILTNLVAIDAQSGSSTAILAGAVDLNKSTAGTVTLSAVNTYTGATNVTDGKLSISSTGRINTSSGVTINGGEFNYSSTTALAPLINFTSGTLSGSGIISSSVTVPTSGFVAPGNSIGTLGVGSTTLSGTYLLEADLLGGADLLNVSGTLTLDGTSTLDLVSASLNPTFTYTIANFTTLGGTFGTVDPAITATHSVSYTSSQILLVPNAIPEPSTMALLALGGAGFCWLRRKRVQ